MTQDRLDSVSSRPPARLAGLAALALATVLASCENGQATQGQPPPPEVDVVLVSQKPARQWDEYSGRITAVDAVELRPRVSGYVQRVAYKEGQEVKQGDLMFQIDPRPYRAALDSAQAQLERARSVMQLAQTQDKRSQELVQAEAASREEGDTRRATFTQSVAEIRVAEAAVATAQLNLGFTEARAPVTGRAGRAMLTVGNLVATDQSLLTTIVSQDPVYVYFDADEASYLRYQAQARSGQRSPADNAVRLGLTGEAGYPHAGTVNFVDNQVNPTTGTVRARAVLPNPDRLFTPGLYARVQFVDRGHFDTILIDEKAVMNDQDHKYVYVVDKEGKAQRKDVVLGRSMDGMRTVTSGLGVGDKVVVAGLQKIFFPGMPVKPNEAAAQEKKAPSGTASGPKPASSEER